MNFSKLLMSGFSEQFNHLNLKSMHSTNPEPFTQKELEAILDLNFSDIIQDVNLGFSADQGDSKLRESIASNLYSKICANDVIAHAGAQEAIFCAFCALLNRNDKVTVISPVFEPLAQIPINLGCEVRQINLNKHDDWSLDLNEVESHFKQGCRLFVINFPHNPTGMTLSNKDLLNIIALCRKYNVWLMSDEVFRGLEHEKQHRLPAIADIYEKGISIGVISKAFAVPGLRVGWMACQNQAFNQKIIDIKSYLSICNSQVDERLVTHILNHANKLLNRNLSIILSNKEKLTSLKFILGHSIHINYPNAGCSLFAEIMDDYDSTKLVNQIAHKCGYLLYPSHLFKTKVNGMRLGFGSRGFSQFLNCVKAFG